jgi:ADP-ribosylglycohydrolase
MEKTVLDYKTYHDKVLGGWSAKFIGGSIGAPFEGQKRLLKYTLEELTTNGVVDNDDTDFQIVWLRVLEKYGYKTSAKELAQAWLDHIDYTFNEYGIAIRNCRMGIMPPYSGWFNNDYYEEAMGCPIRADIWGFVFPANPQMASQYAEQDGIIDHSNNSVWAEMYWAAAGAIAFVESSVIPVLKKAMDYVPEDSELAVCINSCFQLHEQGVSWVDARELILQKYGHQDMTSAMQNQGLIFLALLYCNNDFGELIKLSTNCGYDTDCICGTACAIYGTIKGRSGLPEKWNEWCGDKYELSDYIRGIDIHDKTLTGLTTETCMVGAKLSASAQSPVEIVNVPSMDDPIIEKIPALEMVIDYPQLPSIAFGQSVPVKVTVYNHSDRDVQGNLSVGPDGKWEISNNSAILSVKKGCFAEHVFEISLSSEETELSMKNIFSVSLKDEGGELIQEEFGLAGACQWLLIGPYFDQKNGFEDTVDIDKEYIAEPVSGEYDFKSMGAKVNVFSAAEDHIDIQELISSIGSAVVYLYTSFRSEQKRKVYLMLGSNDGLKVWLNGKLVVQSHEHRLCTPNNEVVEVELNEGVNTICVKLLRCSDMFDFRIGYRDMTIPREPLESERRAVNDSCPYAWHREHWVNDLIFQRMDNID